MDTELTQKCRMAVLKLMDRRGWSKAKYARAIGVSAATMTNIENGVKGEIAFGAAAAFEGWSYAEGGAHHRYSKSWMLQAGVTTNGG